MKDYGYMQYRYSTSFPIAKYIITLSWNKTSNRILLRRLIWSFKKCDYILEHTFIDDEYTKADIEFAKKFFEILIRSYPST